MRLKGSTESTRGVSSPELFHLPQNLPSPERAKNSPQSQGCSSDQSVVSKRHTQLPQGLLGEMAGSRSRAGKDDDDTCRVSCPTKIRGLRGHSSTPEGREQLKRLLGQTGANGAVNKYNNGTQEKHIK